LDLFYLNSKLQLTLEDLFLWCSQTMMDDLPDVLVQQVLSLVDVPELCRFRTVCKRWNSLICMPEFGTLHAQNANMNARFIIGHRRYDNGVEWSVFDLIERRWYKWMGEVVDTSANPLTADGGLVLCSTPTLGELTIFNPMAKTREVLPLPPFQPYWKRKPYSGRSNCDGTNLVVDSISNSYKIFLLRAPPSRVEDPILCVYESTTNQWRSSRTYPPVRQVEGGFAYPTTSIIFQGLLYVLTPFYSGQTRGYRFGPQDHPIKYFLFCYNFVEDSWENTGVDFPNWLDHTLVKIELVAGGDRLFVVSGDNLALEESDNSVRLEGPLSVTEILLADRKLNTVSHWAQPVFGLGAGSSKLKPFGSRHSVYRYNQAFGFSNSIMLTYDWLVFSIVYNLVTCLWELFPVDPNVWLFGNVMPLRLPSASPR
jgi:hypothetical protein